MTRLLRLLPVLAIALAGALAAPAQAAGAATYSVGDPRGDVARWNGGGDLQHAGRSIDLRRVVWRLHGQAPDRTLTATYRLRRVWANRGREREGVEFLVIRPGIARRLAVTAFGPLHRGRPVLETVGRTSDTRHILGCAGLRAVKHPGTDTVTVSLPLSCLPQKYRAAGLRLTADSFLNGGSTTYWFDETRLVRHVDLR